MRHPLDPPAQHHAAQKLGRLVAAGLQEPGECLPHLAAAATRASRADPSGLRARLAHALADATEFWSRRRIRAVRAIRDAIAPPIAARATAAVIRDAARTANAAHGYPLAMREADAIAAATLRRTLRHGA